MARPFNAMTGYFDQSIVDAAEEKIDDILGMQPGPKPSPLEVRKSYKGPFFRVTLPGKIGPGERMALIGRYLTAGWQKVNIRDGGGHGAEGPYTVCEMHPNLGSDGEEGEDE